MLPIWGTVHVTFWSGWPGTLGPRETRKETSERPGKTSNLHKPLLPVIVLYSKTGLKEPPKRGKLGLRVPGPFSNFCPENFNYSLPGKIKIRHLFPSLARHGKCKSPAVKKSLVTLAKPRAFRRRGAVEEGDKTNETRPRDPALCHRLAICQTQSRL